MEENNNNIDIDTLREAYGRVSYTQTTHEYEVQACSKKSNIIKWFNVILTALTFGGIMGVIAFNTDFLKILSAIVSTLSLGIATYQLSFDPQSDEISHKIATKELWYIREKYKNLIADASKKILSEDQIVKRRDELLEELKLVYKFAPNTSNTAYKKAQKAIQSEEEQYFSTEELNNLLPKSLRISETEDKPTSVPKK